jgi:hypothetical protein
MFWGKITEIALAIAFECLFEKIRSKWDIKI